MGVVGVGGGGRAMRNTYVWVGMPGGSVMGAVDAVGETGDEGAGLEVVDEAEFDVRDVLKNLEVVLAQLDEACVSFFAEAFMFFSILLESFGVGGRM